MYLQKVISRKTKKKTCNFLAFWSSMTKTAESSLVSCTDPRIRICTKMSRISNHARCRRFAFGTGFTIEPRSGSMLHCPQGYLRKARGFSAPVAAPVAGAATAGLLATCSTESLYIRACPTVQIINCIDVSSNCEFQTIRQWCNILKKMYCSEVAWTWKIIFYLSYG